MSIASAFVELLVLGLIAGALGQVVRQVGSYKKLLDEHTSDQARGHFDTTRFFINLAVGATAGALGVLTLMPENGKPFDDLRQTFITLIGIGYAGADFVEAFVRRSELAVAAALPAAANVAQGKNPIPDPTST